MPGPTRSIDRQTFLGHLRQSGLVAEAVLNDCLEQLPEDTRGRALARHFVDRGLITRFQAERLLMGRSLGFFMDQYLILEQIGQGGMGRVYRAEQRTLKRIVALKVLASNVLKSERAIELFLHEVRAAAALVHPNIVTAYDASSSNGRYYLVMEYVDGLNLDQLVRRHGRLSVGLACDYIRQAANGLQCAHLQGMVHRDIKPANLLVQGHDLSGGASAGLVKISDFGLARVGKPYAGGTNVSHPGTIMTRDNTVMGTPDFLSPEQARSLHKTDIRSDLYSLGCTFYYLLTGCVPFPGGTALEKLLRHSTDTPASIRLFRADVPEEVTKIIDRLMSKYPGDRYETPAALAAALEPYAVSGPTPWARSTKATVPLLTFTEADDADINVELLRDSDGNGEHLPDSDDDLAPTPPRPRARRTVSLGLAIFLGLSFTLGAMIFTGVVTMMLLKRH
jgi:eukaryotic-like serine/threonine-protein kinase